MTGRIRFRCAALAPAVVATLFAVPLSAEPGPGNGDGVRYDYRMTFFQPDLVVFPVSDQFDLPAATTFDPNNPFFVGDLNDFSSGETVVHIELGAIGEPDPFLETSLLVQNLTDEPLRIDFESTLNLVAPDLPFPVSATSVVELIDGIDGAMTDGSASLLPPQEFIDDGLGMVRPGVGTLGTFGAAEFNFPPDLNMNPGLNAPGVQSDNADTFVTMGPFFPPPGLNNWNGMLMNFNFVLSPKDTAVFHTRIDVVPEPSSALLVLLGLLGVKVRRQRRHRRACPVR